MNDKAGKLNIQILWEDSTWELLNLPAYANNIILKYSIATINHIKTATKKPKEDSYSYSY
jgi:hypothetical protein